MEKLEHFAVLIVLILNGLACALSSDPPCVFELSVDISHGLTLQNGSVLADDLSYTENQIFTHVGENGDDQLRGCKCLVKPCIRKCCADNQVFNGGCVENVARDPNPFSPTVYFEQEELELKADSHFALLHGNICKNGLFMLEPEEVQEDQFFLQEDGTLLMPFSSRPNIDVMNYCLEEFDNKTRALICFDPPTTKGEKYIFLLNALGIIISIPFLIATFLVYAFVPELQNLHGKSLMCYISALIVAYIFLVSTQLSGFKNEQIDITACIVLAFVIYLSFMISFFWLNVMCFDLWWSFREMTGRRGGLAAEKRRFLFYGLYAWGIPILLTGLCALMQFSPSIPDSHIRPQFGDSRCWFHDRKAVYVYFYAPMMILVIANVVFFIMTACRIRSINKETDIMLNSNESSRHSRIEKEKQRFSLYLKLFLVMGINWIAEWISFVFFQLTWIWILTDLCNAFQGIIIFIIFVYNDKTKKLLSKKYRQVRYGSSVARPGSSNQHSSRIVSNDPRTLSTAISENDGFRMSQLNR